MQLIAAPEDRELESALFQELNAACKHYIEQCDIPRAISYLREMQRYHHHEEAAVLIYGWDIFHTLKAISSDEFAKRHYPKAVPELAGSFFILNYPRPSQLHSAILSILCKLAQEQSEWFLPLIRQVGFESLQESDFQPFAKDGKKITPLAETLFLKLSKVIEHSATKEDMEWLLEAYEKYRRKISENQWISYHHGKLLLQLERYDEARQFIQEILNRHKAQFWAWAIMGGSYKESDPQMHLACLCKALSFPTESTLLLNVREELAGLLIKMGLLPEAKTEIETVIATRHLLDLPISSDLLLCLHDAWWKETQAKASNLGFYLKQLPKANELIEDEAAPVPGIVTAFYESTKGVFIQFALDKVALLKYGKCSCRHDFSIGDIVSVSVQEVSIGGQRRYEALNAEMAETLPSGEFIRKISGELKLPQKAEANVFGFVSDVYAPGDAIRGLSNGAKVSGLAIKEFNKKRNQYGWRALIVKPEPVPPAGEENKDKPCTASIPETAGLDGKAEEPELVKELTVHGEIST